MVLTMTPTEFNRARSHAVRVARSGEDVVIRPADGDMADALLLTRADRAMNAVDLAILAGKMTRPKLPMSAPLVRSGVDPALADAALAEFEASRSLYA